MKNLKTNTERVEREVKEKLITYLGAAFGFVAGLAWNDAIKALIDYLFPLDRGGLIAKFVYAFLVTLVLVMVTLILQRLLRKKEEESKL